MKVTITEDQALMLEVSLQSLIDAKIKEGYKVSHTYTHPAVGLVCVLEPDYALAA